MANPDAPAAAGRHRHRARPGRLVFTLLLVISLLVAVYLLVSRVRAGADLLRTWPETAAIAVALIALFVPESERARWFARARWWQVAGLTVTVALLTMATQTDPRPSARSYFDVTAHEQVRPSTPAVFTVSGVPRTGRLTVVLSITDHDPQSTTTGFCENEIAVTVTADAQGPGSLLVPQRIGPARHSFVTRVEAEKDLRLSVEYRSPDPASTCLEDILLESATLG